MADSILMYHRDFVRFQIEFGRLRWDAARYFVQFVARTTYDGSGARARWRTIAFAEATFIIIAAAFEFVVWQVFDWNVTYFDWCRTMWRSTR